jgi:hypothetical protein
MSSLTNDTSADQRNTSSSLCRAKPNGLNDLFSSIDSCTSTTEQQRNNDLASTTTQLKQDITALQANITDSLHMGDAMFGSYGYADITKQVTARNDELKSKKQALLTDIKKKEAIVERSNRDFTDLKDSLPDPQPTRLLHVLEDYTLAVLFVSYLFALLAGLYVYVSLAESKGIALLKGIAGSTIFTAFAFMVTFYLT